MSKQQKFQRFDLVQIADDLGPGMSHFTSGCRAIVMGSYADQYGGSDTNNYTLFIEGEGKSSWYVESRLTLIERNQEQLYHSLKEALDNHSDEQASHAWIFKNGYEVLNTLPSPALNSLAKDLSVDNLWGPDGEGLTWLNNATAIARVSMKFLLANDLAGWLEFSKEVREADSPTRKRLFDDAARAGLDSVQMLDKCLVGFKELLDRNSQSVTTTPV